MPKTLATQSVITINAKPLTLCRPVRPDFAQRLVEQHPRLVALNAAGKTQKDAADALGISVPLLRNWLELLGIKWTNVQPRAPYSTR